MEGQPQLGEVKISEVGARGEDFYQLAPPGRKPELWGATEGEEGLGPWFSLFTCGFGAPGLVTSD